MADFWFLSLENLRRFLEEGKAPVLCDYSTAPRGGAELVVDIEAPPEAVFRALTHPSDLDRWMTAKSSVDPVAGGRISFGWATEGPVRVLSIVPNEKLSYSWEHANDPETVVTWTLEAPNGRRTATRLTLLHSGFGERDTEDFRTGWLKHVSWMKALLERGNSWVPPSKPWRRLRRLSAAPVLVPTVGASSPEVKLVRVSEPPRLEDFRGMRSSGVLAKVEGFLQSREAESDGAWRN